MSQRELRALRADQREDSSTRRRTRSSTRSSRDMAEEKIAELEAKLEEALGTIDEQKVELQKAKENDLQWKQRLEDATAELEAATLRAEVEKLRALEKVREEERERSQAWADDLRERFKAEKVLEEKIAMLEAKGTSRASTSTTSASPSESSTTVTTAVSTSTPSTAVTAASTASGALSSGSSFNLFGYIEYNSLDNQYECDVIWS